MELKKERERETEFKEHENSKIFKSILRKKNEMRKEREEVLKFLWARYDIQRDREREGE